MFLARTPVLLGICRHLALTILIQIKSRCEQTRPIRHISIIIFTEKVQRAFAGLRTKAGRQAKNFSAEICREIGEHAEIGELPRPFLCFR